MGNFYKTQWAGQNNSIDVNFHLQKSFWEKKSTDKIWSNKVKEIKMSL